MYFKIILITIKAWFGLVPPSISELLSPYAQMRYLRSSHKTFLSFPKLHLYIKLLLTPDLDDFSFFKIQILLLLLPCVTLSAVNICIPLPLQLIYFL